MMKSSGKTRCRAERVWGIRKVFKGTQVAYLEKTRLPCSVKQLLDGPNRIKTARNAHASFAIPGACNNTIFLVFLLVVYLHV